MVRPRQHLKNMYREGQPYFSRFELDRLGYNEYVPYAEANLYEKLRSKLSNEIISAYPSVNDAYKAVSEMIEQPIERLMLTTGSDGAIFNIFLTFCDPHDEVILVTPNYGMYYVYADMMNTVKKEVKYNTDFSLDYKKIFDAVSEKTKIIALANPSGFSGERIQKDELLKLIKKAHEVGCIVLIDEVYADFVDYGKSEYFEYLNTYDNIVITRSLSKSYGLAGLRVGYLVCNETTCTEISRVRQNVEINSIAVEALKIWCSEKEYLKNCITQINTSRDKVVQNLVDMGYEVRNSVTNFCFINIGRENIGKFRKLITHEKIEVKIVDSIYPDYIRVTVGKYEYMQHFLKVMKNFKNEIGSMENGETIQKAF